jgi:hypothetical protein
MQSSVSSLPYLCRSRPPLAQGTISSRVYRKQLAPVFRPPSSSSLQRLLAICSSSLLASIDLPGDSLVLRCKNWLRSCRLSDDSNVQVVSCNSTPKLKQPSTTRQIFVCGMWISTGSSERVQEIK